MQSITTAPVVSSDHQISLAIKNRDGNTIDGFGSLGVAQSGNEEFYFGDETQDDSFQKSIMVNPTAHSDSFRFQNQRRPNTLSDFEFGSTFLDWNPIILLRLQLLQIQLSDRKRINNDKSTFAKYRMSWQILPQLAVISISSLHKHD